MTKRILSAIFKLIFILGCGLGIYLNLATPYGYDFGALAYYTTLSNLLCLGLMTVLFFFELFGKKYHDGFAYQTFKFCALVCILLTFCVYHGVLAPKLVSPAGTLWGSLANRLIHTFSPVMFFLDWLIFDKKRAFRWVNPILGLILPAVYLMFVFVYVRLGGSFGGASVPYFFLDRASLGTLGVLKWLGILSAGIVLVGYLLCVLDRILPGRHSKRRRR